MPKGDKYLELTKYLEKAESFNVEITFKEIEKIVGFRLPDSAYVHIPWWSNTESHSQAHSWMNAGYYTSDCSRTVPMKKVTFCRRIY